MEKKLTCHDLMVGDLVCYCKENNYVTKVESIHNTGHTSISDEYYIKCFRDRKDLLYDKNPIDFFNIEILHPIPLTAEILEKSGFKLYKQDFTSRRVYKFGCFDYIEINDYNENNRYNYFSIGCYKEYEHFGTLQRYIHDVMKIRYVHELQHALRLCGIDNEIVL